MADSHNSNSTTSPAEQDRIARSVALAEIIAAHTQPDDATHFSLEESEYLAEGDVRVQETTQQYPETPATPRPAARMISRNRHLESAHMRLQAILNDTDDEDAERWQTSETAAEQGDQETRMVEEQVYLNREHTAIFWLRAHQVPLLYNPRSLLRAYYAPERIEGLLRPFYWHPPLDFDAPVMHFFERQRLRYQEFQRFQAINRGIDTLEPAAMEEAYLAALIREATNAHHWLQLVANPGCNGSAGRRSDFWARRADEKELLREEACSNFDEYQAAVRARLARNRVEVPANFALLNEEFAHQDRLTMWSEYLAFEFWFMEQYDDDVCRYRPSHDAAYAQLKTTAALRSHETAEFLPTRAAATQRTVEETEAQGRLDLAELTFQRLQIRPRGRSHMELYGMHARRTRQLAEAQAEVAAADEAREEVVRRNAAVVAFLKETEAWREACDNRSRHDALLAWATDRWYDIQNSAGAPLAGEDEETIRSLNLAGSRQAGHLPAAQSAAVAAWRIRDAADAQVESVIAEDGRQATAAAAAEAEAASGPSRDEDVQRGVARNLPSVSGAVSSPSVSPRSRATRARVAFPGLASPRRTESPLIELPLAEKSAAREKLAKQSSAREEEPPVEQSTVENPSAEESSAQESSNQEPSAEEPSAEEPSIEQPSAKEPSAEQSSVDKSPLQQPSVKKPSKVQPATELPPVEQSAIVPPLARQATEEQRLPVIPASEETTTATRAAAPVPEPRRSARIAARRQKAAEETALQSTQTNIPAETTTRVQSATKKAQKRGRGKAAAEDETQDAKPPAKRTRRRAARK